MIEFSSLMGCLEKTDRSVFYLDDAVISGKNFTSRMESMCHQLSRYKHQRIGLYFNSTFDFSLTFLSVLYAGKTPVILPNIQAGFVNSIAENLDILMTDAQIECSLNILTLAELDQHKLKNQDPVSPDLSLSTIELFTSGSSGLPKRIIKSLKQLEAEVETLERCWGDSVNNSMIVSTVSHQHIYGLLFKVLWPLFSERPLLSSVCHYPEQWLALSDNFPKITLISSPAHLKRAHSLVDLSLMQDTVQMVFSSGGPLTKDDSRKVYEQLKTPVIEVYGSTETGGIAFRTQFENGQENQLWKALPDVTLGVDKDTGCLNVDSPFTGVHGWYQTSDLIELVSSSEFLLKGRADRIVKIEEKRVSLAEMENHCVNSPLIDQAVAIALSGKRNFIGCIIVLSKEGLEYFSKHGKTALNKTIKIYLSNYFETVVLPRKWRYVSELAVNNQGKLLLENLKSYFKADYKGTIKPIINHIQKHENEVNLSIYIPPDLLYFEGHFLKKPIVPGVVQIEWAGCLGEEHLSVRGEFSELEVVKFHEFINPGDSISLDLRYMADKNKLSFSYSSEKGKHSSGRIVYQD